MLKKRHSNLSILITGAAGFVGRNLVKSFLNNGYKVTVLVRSHISIDIFEKDHVNLNVAVGRLSDKSFVGRVLNGIDQVYHLSSSTIPGNSNKQIQNDIEDNLLGSINLLDACIKNNVQKFCFISSGGAIYGDPKYLPVDEVADLFPFSSYGIVKLAIERYIHLYNHIHGLKYVVLRVSNIYGNTGVLKPGFSAVDTFIERFLNNEEITIFGDGSIVRDYIYIDDVINAFNFVVDYTGDEHIFNIGSGVGTSLNELITHIAKATQMVPKVKYIDARPSDNKVSVLDIRKARNILHWESIYGLQDGVKKILSMKSIASTIHTDIICI